MSRNLLWFYLIVLICVMVASEPSTFQSIVLNFDVVLSLVMYIQGLSVIHFLVKLKDGRTSTILVMVVGTLLTPATHIVGLLGVIDLCINFKENNKK